MAVDEFIPDAPDAASCCRLMTLPLSDPHHQSVCWSFSRDVIKAPALIFAKVCWFAAVKHSHTWRPARKLEPQIHLQITETLEPTDEKLRLWIQTQNLLH